MTEISSEACEQQLASLVFYWLMLPVRACCFVCVLSRLCRMVDFRSTGFCMAVPALVDSTPESDLTDSAFQRPGFNNFGVRRQRNRQIALRYRPAVIQSLAYCSDRTVMRAVVNPTLTSALISCRVRSDSDLICVPITSPSLLIVELRTR